MSSIPYTSYTKIDKTNVLPFSPMLSSLIRKGQYIAIDFEFTGLGEMGYNKLEKDINLRYKKMRENVQQFSLLSMGLSFFHQKESNENLFLANSFELTLSCQTTYKINPSSLEFLLDNGFDINNQIKNGIPYFPGDNGIDKELLKKIEPNNKKFKREERPLSQPEKYNRILRTMVYELITSSCTLILHNGLLDLMYLYNSFFATLPLNLDTFIADVSSWPIIQQNGLFDTKCLAEFQFREKASYLSFLFNKAYREQTVLKKMKQIMEDDSNELKNINYFEVNIQPGVNLNNKIENDKKEVKINPKDSIDYNIDIKIDKEYCMRYIYHGNCPNKPNKQLDLGQGPNQQKCMKSHHLLNYLNHCLKLQLYNTKNNSDPNVQVFLFEHFKSNTNIYQQSLKVAEDIFISNKDPTLSDTKHTAPYDAFMTAYTFLHFLFYPDVKLRLDNNKEFKNNIYLMGRNLPLKIVKSKFTQCSNSANIILNNLLN
ncbi:ribonuclease CAF1 [Neoconidiobolus thromboides FSU 785]|nr:ribonuclease CAF1 [Neoconidiobolus thromboides FSU 785]